MTKNTKKVDSNTTVVDTGTLLKSLYDQQVRDISEKITNLASREKSLNERETIFRTKKEELDVLERQLRERDEAITLKESEVDRRLNSVISREGELEKKHVQITNNEIELRKEVDKLKETQKGIEDRIASIVSKEADIKKRQDAIFDGEVDLKKRLDKHNEHKAKLKEKYAMIQEAERNLSCKETSFKLRHEGMDTEIADFKRRESDVKKVESSDKDVMKTQALLELQTVEIKTLKSLVDTKNSEVQALRSELDKVKGEFDEVLKKKYLETEGLFQDEVFKYKKKIIEVENERDSWKQKFEGVDMKKRKAETSLSSKTTVNKRPRSDSESSSEYWWNPVVSISKPYLKE